MVPGSNGLRLMDTLPHFFDFLKKKGVAKGHFLGFLHVLIARRIAQSGGAQLSNGMTWREVSAWLKKVRWDPEAVRELGQDPDMLPPRDRERFWYSAIARAAIDSPSAAEAGDRFAEILRERGYEVGSPPRR
jgi:hypothetical protein